MIHLIVGLIALCLGAWGLISWWHHFGDVLRGFIPILFVLTGLAAIGAGFQKTMGDTPGEDEEDRQEADHGRAAASDERRRPEVRG